MTAKAKTALMTVKSPAGPITNIVLGGKPGEVHRVNGGTSEAPIWFIVQVWIDTAGGHHAFTGSYHSLS